MGRVGAAARRAGGGEIVQASRQSGTRLALGAFACAVLAAIAAHAVALAPADGAALAPPGALALLLLALGVWRGWTSAVPLALALVGGAYAAALLLADGGVDGAAPLVAAGALLVAELAYWATAPRAVPAATLLLRRQLVTAGALAVVSLCLGTLLLLVGGTSVRGGLPLEALGVAAAIAALAVVARLARS